MWKKVTPPIVGRVDVLSKRGGSFLVDKLGVAGLMATTLQPTLPAAPALSPTYRSITNWVSIPSSEILGIVGSAVGRRYTSEALSVSVGEVQAVKHNRVRAVPSCAGARQAAVLGTSTATFRRSMCVDNVDRSASEDGGADGATEKRLKGAHFNKRTGKWTSRIVSSGKATHLGTFDSAEAAAEAYALAVEKVRGVGDRDAASGGKLHGVVKVGKKRWEAEVTVNDAAISGGVYDTEEEAGRAADALARMYLGPEAPLNYDLDEYTSWRPQDEDVMEPFFHVIPERVGEYFSVEEVVASLEAEKGINVVALDLKGRSDLAEWMVFVTGRSVGHMRKMGDMLVTALRKRQVSESAEAAVEGRDMDDWMVVDAGTVIINIFEAEARECFDLENFYSTMELGVDPYEGWTYEEWLEANPVPDKWIKRLENDEAE